MRKIFHYIVIIFELFLIVSLVQGIRLSLQSTWRISALEAAKKTLLAERARLLAQYQYVQSPLYLEEVARDQLHMNKPGETVVIVPQGSAQPMGDSGQRKQVVTVPNWKKWWGVIRGQE